MVSEFLPLTAAQPLSEKPIAASRTNGIAADDQLFAVTKFEARCGKGRMPVDDAGEWPAAARGILKRKIRLVRTLRN